MLGRRGFLKAIGAGVLGMALALKAPEVKEESIEERFIRQWNEQSKVARIDVLYGYANLKPEYAARDWSA